MRFVKVDREEIKTLGMPEKKHDVVGEMIKFMDMGVEAAKVVVDADEYANNHSLINAIRKTVCQCGLPIKTRLIGDRVYLIREDI